MSSNVAKLTSKIPSSIVSRLTSVVEPVVYYSKVATHFFGLIAKHQKITLPLPAHFAEAQASLGHFFISFQNGSWRKVTIGQAGSILGEVVKIGGFFYVGEMIGRGSIVGYNIPGSGHSDSHH